MEEVWPAGREAEEAGSDAGLVRDQDAGADLGADLGEGVGAEASAGSVADVSIVGGGPAGLAAAIALTLKGFSVQVVDGMTPPIDKACGEGLMPDTLAALEELGVLLGAEDGFRLRGIRFFHGDEGTPMGESTVEAAFAGGAGRGVRRLLLHRRLLERAAGLGVRFHWRTVAHGLVECPGHVLLTTNQGTMRSRFLIGADGHMSRIRAWAGLDRATVSARRIGLRQHFACTPWTNSVEVYWSSHGQAYVTPVSDSEVCVAFVSRDRHASIAEALNRFPRLQTRLAAAAANGGPRGSVTFSRKLQRVTRGAIALLGDASGSVDAVTGEGLSLCFRQALALAAALARSDVANPLAVYQRAHTAMRRLPHLMAGAMLLMDRSSTLRRRAMKTFARHPELFQQMLEVHIGQAPVRVLGRSGLLATGIHLLTA